MYLKYHRISLSALSTLKENRPKAMFLCAVCRNYRSTQELGPFFSYWFLNVQWQKWYTLRFISAAQPETTTVATTSAGEFNSSTTPAPPDVGQGNGCVKFMWWPHWCLGKAVLHTTLYYKLHFWQNVSFYKVLNMMRLRVHKQSSSGASQSSVCKSQASSVANMYFINPYGCKVSDWLVASCHYQYRL